MFRCSWQGSYDLPTRSSDLSAYVTGTTTHVDGGTSASLGFINWPFGDGWLAGPFAATLTRLYGDK